MRRQRPALVVVGAVACLAACSSPLTVDVPEVSDDTARRCRQLVDALPQRVAGQERREVGSPLAAAYGDPAIVLRCGVPGPTELTTNCMTVASVDWYAPDAQVEDADSDVVATTVGRAPVVELTVPARYKGGNAPLADVSPVVDAHTTVTQECPGPRP